MKALQARVEKRMTKGRVEICRIKWISPPDLRVPLGQWDQLRQWAP